MKWPSKSKVAGTATEDQDQPKNKIKALISGISGFQTSAPPKEPMFTLFPQLPKELQLIIWKFAAEQRYPEALSYLKNMRSYVRRGEEHYNQYGTIYSQGIPALLQVNQDSRAAAAKAVKQRYEPVNSIADFFGYTNNETSLKTFNKVYKTRIQGFFPGRTKDLPNGVRKRTLRQFYFFTSTELCVGRYHVILYGYPQNHERQTSKLGLYSVPDMMLFLNQAVKVVF